MNPYHIKLCQQFHHVSLAERVQCMYAVLAFRDAKQYPFTITRLLSSLCRWCVQIFVTKPSAKYYTLSNLKASIDFLLNIFSLLLTYVRVVQLHEGEVTAVLMLKNFF